LDVFSIIASPALLAEFEQVIGRRKFRLPRVSRDPDYDEVLALAVSARADLIVTGDDDLLSLREHAGVRIVGPAEALRLIVRSSWPVRTLYSAASFSPAGVR
jgi:predicted nucleic acid-binding protein